MRLLTHLGSLVRGTPKHRGNGAVSTAEVTVQGSRVDDGLRELIQKELGDRLLVVVSNREPYVHNHGAKGIEWTAPIGGLTAALDPVMRASGGIWIAHGSGDADRETATMGGKVPVPPQGPRYTLRRVWLTQDQEERYYSGFANQALWPLCHVAYERPTFVEDHWRAYVEVNQLFADAVVEEVGDREALIFVQDYHLALLPRLLRERCPSAIIAQFWHIPWPSREVFRICPWGEELLDGLLGNHLLAFHTRDDCEAFVNTVDRSVESLVSRGRLEVTRGGKKTVVRPYPIGVDWEGLNKQAQSRAVEDEMRRLRSVVLPEGRRVGLGLDRIDYTKGIPERVAALEALFEKYPEYREKVVFVQVCAASRMRVEAYRRLGEEIIGRIEALNRRYGTETWTPVFYLEGEKLSPIDLMALRRTADFCIVNSLHDGMNLVAKEYVASRIDEDGVLILSQFTGAAQELPEAVLVNPYARDQLAEATRTALEMPQEERRRRMRLMRRTVQGNSILRWETEILAEMSRLGRA